mgnify:CR=1 FL=1
MSNKRSNNTLVWSIVPTAICIVCTIVIIILLCIYFPRHQELDFDYIGIIIGILSVLVTVLIGWNIYTALDLSKRAKKIEDELYTITQDTQKALLDIQQRTKEQFDNQSTQNAESEEYMLGSISFVQGMIMMNTKDHRKILNAIQFLSAISHFAKSHDTKDAIKQSLVEFRKCIELEETHPNHKDLYDIDINIINKAIKDIETSSNTEFTDEFRNEFRELSIRFIKICESHKEKINKTNPNTHKQ